MAYRGAGKHAWAQHVPDSALTFRVYSIAPTPSEAAALRSFEG